MMCLMFFITGVILQMKVKFFNDTGREVSIHPATFAYGCKANKDIIRPLEVCIFELPEGTTLPEIKMWDYGDKGLSVLVTPADDDLA